MDWSKLPMSFFKRLLEGLFGGSAPRDNALYVYVRPKLCKEVLVVRVDLYNQLSLTEDESGYLVRKEARGNRCPFPVEVVLHFDRNRRVVEKEITNGEFVTEADYAAFMAEQTN
jgi:hypothetical protein